MTSKKPLPRIPRTLAFADDTTFNALRAAVKEGILKDAGVLCPCCDQQASVYYRRVNRSIVKVIAALGRFAEENGMMAWANIPTLFSTDPALRGSKASQGGQWAQAEKWWLVERKRGDQREDGSSRTGLARITKLGVAFLAGKYRIREYAIFYNNTLLGKAGDPMRVDDVRDFDYQEIFGGRRPDADEIPDEPLSVSNDAFLDASSLVFGVKNPEET
jgi:hypothetical protein